MATTVLTPEQQAAAIALYAQLLALQQSGSVMAIVQFNPIGVRPVGKRKDVVLAEPPRQLTAGATIKLTE